MSRNQEDPSVNVTDRTSANAFAIAKRGRLAWLFFAVLSLPYILVYFHRVAPAVVADSLMADFAISGAVTGNLAAIYFYVYTLMQLPAGVLADSLGPRRTIAIGSLIAAIGSLLFGLAPTLAYAYGGRFLVGLGVSVVFVPLLRIYTDWFSPEKFAAMSGITLVVGSSGALIAAAPLAFLADTIGWRMAFVVVGVLGVVGSALTFLIVRDRPEDLNLPPVIEKSAAEQERALPPFSDRLKETLRGLAAVTRSGENWRLSLSYFGIYGPLMAFQGAWGATYLMHLYGRSRSEAAMDILPIAVGMIIGSPLIGWLSGRIGKLRGPFLAASILYTSTWLALLWWPGSTNGLPPLAALPILFTLMGIGASGFILTWSIARRRNAPELTGSALGFVNMGGFLGGAIMQPLFGVALDWRWQGELAASGNRIYPLQAYQLGLVFCLAVSLMTIILLFTINDAPRRSTR